MSRDLFKKLIVAQMAKEFPDVNETRRSITVFTRAGTEPSAKPDEPTK
jgi:hypothetical protein